MKTSATPKAGTESVRHFITVTARSYAPHLLAVMGSTAILGVLSDIVTTLAFPVIFSQIEHGATLSKALIITLSVALTALVLTGLHTYIDGLFCEKRDQLRTSGNTALVKRALSMSYPHAVDPAHTARLHRASAAMGTHIEAPVPHAFKTISNLLINGIGGCLYALLLCGGNLLLVLITTVTALLSALVHHAVSEWGYRHRHDEAASDEQTVYLSRIASSGTFSKDIRIFGLAPWIGEMYDRSIALADAFIRRRAAIYFLFNAADAVLTLLRNGLAYALLIRMARTEQLPLGMFILLFSAVGMYSMSVSGLFADVMTLRRECRSLREYLSFFAKEEPFLFDGGKAPAIGCAHTLTLCDVHFTYPQSNTHALRGINLTLHPNERLAIVGRDGVGKSTLAKLLCGLYDPDKGSVLLDGDDVKTLDRNQYYALFSAVLGDTALPGMTIRELITAGKAVEEARLPDSLQKAGFDTVVKRLPHGLDTLIGREWSEDGVELSGGETQRLLLARALYKDGDILVLDEPTAALDPLAEHAVYSEYDRMTAGKSAVFISHRLASTRFCDRIVYLKDGVITEEGTHEQLLANGGDYAQLFALQSRYYREGRDPDGETIG